MQGAMLDKDSDIGVRRQKVKSLSKQVAWQYMRRVSRFLQVCFFCIRLNQFDIEPR